MATTPMVNLWNPAYEAEDFIFTLFFTGGHYNFPIHLGPRAAYMLNLSEVVHNQIADAEGNIIPVSVEDGGRRLSGPKGENQRILVAVDAATSKVLIATCVLNVLELVSALPRHFSTSFPSGLHYAGVSTTY